METRTYKVYTFDELTEEQQAKALEKHRDMNVEYNDWQEFLLDDWKERLEAMGFEKPEIRFSGFWSQGDGASFTAKYINLEKLLSHMVYCTGHYVQALELGMILAEADLIEASITGSHAFHYVHERSVRLEVESHVYSSHAKWDRLTEDLQAGLDDFRVDLCHKIYKELETEYYWHTSDEQVAETLRANEYTFTEDGEID
jgi:hypothetical protein